MEDYKSNIAQTRVGCLGGSDGKMLAQIASLGYVPKSAMKRLAVCKGIVQQEDIPYTAAVRAGDEIENAIYKHISETNPYYQSNPLWVSEKYSTKNVKLIAHPDIVLKDDERKTVYIYEVKTTKFSIEETRQTYKAQLFIESLLGKELASTYGKGWKVKLFLVHYNTDGLDLENGIDFEPERMTIKEVRFTTPFFDIKRTMIIVDDFLETFNEYYEGDEIPSEYLPSNIREQFITITNVLQEIKKREKQVDDFKAKLTKFMKEKGIKSIKNDNWNITFVNETESRGFDSKRFLEDMVKEHPRKAKKLLITYEKRTKRSAFVQIKLKDNNETNK